MCGIAGVFSAVSCGDEERAAVRRMTGALTHRGPDDEGYYFDSHVALGMRRLSIIDVQGGHQPLYAPNESAVIVCNGEIYNFVELHQEQARKGYKFTSRSDVEAVLPLYLESGPSCLGRLRGMFAFALWDREKRRLLLARDRFGEKPLYLYQDSARRLWFASEMKALLAGVPNAAVPMSPEAAYLFMVYQYVPEPLTMLEGVFKLPAASYLYLGADQLQRESIARSARTYWTYQGAPARQGDAPQLVRAALEEASRITLRSDVPVGIALSGGIDSSVVAALARKFHPGELKAFSVGYPGRPENDEREAAQQLARKLEIAFHDVELSSDAFVRDFPKLVYDMDDPVGDIAAYGYHAVSGLAREHGVPVLLSGMGADELFWGYEWVRQAVSRSIAKQSRRRPRWLSRLLDDHPRRAIFYDMLDWMREAAPAAHRMLGAHAAHVGEETWTRYFEAEDWGDVPLWLMQVQNETWLASNCLALSDRMSMAHSVELRLPFLDFSLSDLVTGLRKGGLDDWQQPHKWVLIEAVRDLVPEEILRRKKRGFTPPVMEWMDRIVRAYAPLVREGSLVRHGILNANAATSLPMHRPTGLAYRVVLLEIWARLYVERTAVHELGRSSPVRGY